MYRAVGEDGAEAAEEGVPPTAPPKVQAGNKLEASLKAVGDTLDVPLSPQARLAKSAGMVAVPGGAVQLPAVLRRYQTDMTGVQTACVAPFLIDKYEVTNAQYYQFWQSLTPQWQKLNGELYYPVGWGPRKTPFPADMSDVPVLGVRLAGTQAYATWAGKRLPTPYEWCLAAFGPGGGSEMPDWVKRYIADKQAAWQKVVQSHTAYTQMFPLVHQSGYWTPGMTLQFHLP